MPAPRPPLASWPRRRPIARLQHPNIVQIHHIGEADGLPFFELEYVDGGSLDRRLNGTPWPARRAAELIEPLARGVAEAHRLGIVHRDLKPGNVLLAADGTPKLTDFGLAKSLDSDSGLTRTDSIMGSPGYMAPEQAEGKTQHAGPLGRRLFAGSDPVRASDRRSAIPGYDRPGDPRSGQEHRAGAAVAAGFRPAAGRGDDRAEMLAEGAGEAL